MLSCRPTATRAVQDGILDGHHSACEPPVGGRCGTVGRRLLTTLRAHRNAAEKGRHLARFFFEAFRRSLEQAMPREHGFHSRFECSLGSSSCWHQSLCSRLLRLMFPSMVSSPADRVLQILPDPLCVCATHWVLRALPAQTRCPFVDGVLTSNVFVWARNVVRFGLIDSPPRLAVRPPGLLERPCETFVDLIPCL